MFRSHVVLAVFFSLLMGVSCSSRLSAPVGPDFRGQETAENSGRCLWGFWQISINRQSDVVEVVPVRSASLHINAVRFIEPKTGSTVKISGVTVSDTTVECDVTLTHPFPGLTEYTGFDVHGILISNGSVSGFDDPGVVLAGAGDSRLLNADGFTRWWNPVEFPDNGTMFSYRDGKLGTKNSVAHFNCTVNAYKAFADCLDADDPVTRLADNSLPHQQSRGVFSAGSANKRHYVIDFKDNGSGGPLMVFNYAVDASWEPVTKPVTVPDSFPPEANMPEAFVVRVNVTGNTLYRTPDGGAGGEVKLGIDVYDWQGALGAGNVADEVTGVFVESPTLFDGSTAASVVPGSGSGLMFSTWTVEIGGAPPTNDDQMLLVRVVSKYGNWQPEFTGFEGSVPLTAYQVTWVPVSNQPPFSSLITLIAPNGGEKWGYPCPQVIKWTSGGDPIPSVKLEYSTDGFVSDIHEIAASTTNDGEYEWVPPEIDSDTVRVRVSAAGNPSVFDISDSDFELGTPGPAIWPTFKYDYQNKGRSPFAGPKTANQIWAASLSGQITPSASIGADGTIYAGTNNGKFFALSPEGDILWSLDLGLFVLGAASITEGGRVYAGSWNGSTGYLYAIECDGDIIWKFDCHQNINQTSPVIAADGTVYMADNGGTLWAVNPDGTEKWHFSTGGGFAPTPALGKDGKIYFAVSNGHVYKVTDNGQGSYSVTWDHNFNDHITCPPCLDDNGILYVVGLYNPYLTAIDPSTDTVLWYGHTSDGFTESSPTVGPDGRVYVGCDDGKVYAFEQGGAVAWTFPTGVQVTSSPVLDPDGRLYVASRNHWIYCLDSKNGSQIWSFETGDIIRPSAAIAPDGTLYFGGHDGYLRAFRDK